VQQVAEVTGYSTTDTAHFAQSDAMIASADEDVL
jgi:hypothetical protein